LQIGDLLADETGGVLLATRDAQGGGTLNCGNPANLCLPPSPPIPCYDMYLVRFDGATERWATKLTTSSSALPPYSTGSTGGNVFMIWWYAHHGRLATDGTNYAAYFGVAASVSQGACIDIHQGNRMQVVNPSGALLSGHDSFDWGCSHSGYERIAWDPRSSHFVTVCKTDNNRITFAPAYGHHLPCGSLVLGPRHRLGQPGLLALPATSAQASKTPMPRRHLAHFIERRR
jgi:hypothetical protein